MTYRQIRIQAGYTQKKISDIIGCHRSTVYKFEHYENDYQPIREFYEKMTPICRFQMLRMRSDCNLTQEQAGEIAGVTADSYALQELGKRMLKREVFEKIKQYCSNGQIQKT